jgi:hypothetical protein
MNSSRLVIIGLAISSCTHATSAAPILWDLASGGNGHYYDRIDESGLTWDQANGTASSLTHNGLPGHLVTITSSDEQDFLVNNVQLPGNLRFWLGGFQDTSAPDYSEPDGGWTWVTGENFNYTNWNQSTNPNQDQPNNFNNFPENYLGTYVNVWKWNDLPNNVGAFFGTVQIPIGFVVEFEPVPEPATAVLAAICVGSLFVRRRSQAPWTSGKHWPRVGLEFNNLR